MLPVLGAIVALIGSAAVAGSAPAAYYPSLGYGQGAAYDGPGAYDDGPEAYDDGPEAYAGEPARGPDGIRQVGPGGYVDDPVHGPNLIRPAPGPCCGPPAP